MKKGRYKLVRFLGGARINGGCAVAADMAVDTGTGGARPEGRERPANNSARQGLTNFFIDEILKPDFGRREEGSCSSCRRRDGASDPDGACRGEPADDKGTALMWPAWVYCTRYSDRPSSGPRSRKAKRKEKAEEKRPRTAFTSEQLQRLRREFEAGKYLTEDRRQTLAKELGLNESQIKIWFQNKRAKMKKVGGIKNLLAMHLMAQGLYKHSSSSGHEDSS